MKLGINSSVINPRGRSIRINLERFSLGCLTQFTSPKRKRVSGPETHSLALRARNTSDAVPVRTHTKTSLSVRLDLARHAETRRCQMGRAWRGVQRPGPFLLSPLLSHEAVTYLTRYAHNVCWPV